MGEHPWYKRYGADFIHGTLGLSLEEKGAYSLCLDLIYDRGGPIPDDARWLAGICGVSVRKWNSIRLELIKAGKITSENGFISNFRADKELENLAKTSRNSGKVEDKSAEKRTVSKETKDLTNAVPRAGAPEDARSQIREERKNPPAPNGAAPPTVEMPPLPKFLERTKDQKDASTGTKKRKTRLAPDWKPTAKHFSLGGELGFDDGWVHAEAAKFRDHAEATGRLLERWNAGFSMWLRKAPEFASRGSSPAGQGHAQPDRRGPGSVVAALRDLQGGVERADD